MTDNGPSRPHHDTSTTSAMKATLRSRRRQVRRSRRDATSPSDRIASGQALAAALLPHLGEARCVASFEPRAMEPNVAALNEAVLSSGARLIVPITLDDLDLSWRDATTGEDLGRHAIATADVVVAPALAIGPEGERLGQGGGCYDRALPRRRADARVVAVVFPEEFGEALPVEPHDERVDGVLTEAGITWFTRRASDEG